MNALTTITRAYVDDLIDFAPTEDIRAAGIGDLQRDGCVALFNMLVTNGVAYLADEVGMGKTYIGLAVMSLMRYQKPDARVLVITPRRNIQEKWASDLQNFVRHNWKRADHRVKTPQGSPDFPTRTPDRLADWLNDLHDEGIGAHDTFLRMTSFSLGTDDETGDTFSRFKKNLSEDVRHRFAHLRGPQSPEEFSRSLRTVLDEHPYDLIIVDEAHNLRHGFQPGQASSIRNAVLHYLFGNAIPDPRPRLLMLSATPMENGDPDSLVRQFQVFGLTEKELRKPLGSKEEPIVLNSLAGNADGSVANPGELRERQKRLIVRRVGELRLPDQTALTRNMYRREWRAGGLTHPDQPMERPSVAVRLANAVLQKNVFEMLQATSGGRFRIGALESFEIYSGHRSAVTEIDNSPSASADSAPDQHVIAKLNDSFRKAFGDEVPHPKLNAVSALLKDHLQRRQKALVFVRRVATTWDLATRVSYAFDEELETRLLGAIRPEDRVRVDSLISAWANKRSERKYEDEALAEVQEEPEETPRLSVVAEGDDAGSETKEDDASISEVVPSLFTWFFRGEQRAMSGFTDIYGGRRLREQLEASSRLCILLEENYVDWLLGRPDSIIDILKALTGRQEDQILTAIRDRLPVSIDRERSFRRQYHAVQFAALQWLTECGAIDARLNNVALLKDVLYPNIVRSAEVASESGVETIRELLETLGLYPALARVSKESPLSRVVARGVFEDINEKANLGFRRALRRREQIRLMQMALLRHGAPVLDLYFAALKVRSGAFVQASGENPPPTSVIAQQLVQDWLESAKQESSWQISGAWELAEVNRNFDLIKKLNLHALDQFDDEDRPLDAVFFTGPEPASDGTGRPRSARRVLNQELAGQAPTAAAQGGQSDERRHRLTTQFRMPGMPWVLVATSVYEEGVDLHTYCRTIIHHGISHSATSVEQRTGRVDRIGGLLQRSAAEVPNAEAFAPELMIQSLFPYQNDTFEKHQVRRVLHNCNRFLRSLHDTEAPAEDQLHTDLTDKRSIPKQITDRLQSPFDVSSSDWLAGELTTPDRASDFDPDRYRSEVRQFEGELRSHFADLIIPQGQDLERRYQIGTCNIHLTPHSHREGDGMELHLRLAASGADAEKITLSCESAGGGWAPDAMNAVQEPIGQSLASNG